MTRLNIVRKNLYDKYDQMKRVALNMAYINKINELLLPFESDEQSNVIEATVLKELLAWGAIVLKDATWNTFSEDALNQLIFDMDTHFKPPDLVLQKTDNSGYFKENEFSKIQDDTEIVEKIRKINSDQEAYGFSPLGADRGGENYYGFNTKMSSYFNFKKHANPQQLNQTKMMYKIFNQRMGFVDGLLEQVCHKLARQNSNLEVKFKNKKNEPVSDFDRNCANIHYGIELWDKKRIDSEEAIEAVNAAEKIKLNDMLKIIDEGMIYREKIMGPTLMSKRLLELRLTEELSYLESLLVQREQLINIVPQVTKYRDGKDEEEPLSKITFSLSQLLNYPDRQERPAKLCIIVRGLPGSGRNKIADYIKSTEKFVGGDRAAKVKIIPMKFNKSKMSECLKEEKDMIRFLTREHDILEEVVIYDNLKPEMDQCVIYVIEGIFYKKSQYKKIVDCASENGFVTLIAESRPPKLKDAEADIKRSEAFLQKCTEKAKSGWGHHLRFLMENHEALDKNNDIALDVWELYED